MFSTNRRALSKLIRTGIVWHDTGKMFKNLDAPVFGMGSENLPAIALNSTLEASMLPNAQKVSKKIKEILLY